MVVGTPESASARAGGEPLLTVTPTGAEAAGFPAASKARAVKLCAPVAAEDVFRDAVSGDAVSVDRTTPSTRNSTRVTPTLSEALAVSVTVPLTVVPAEGAVKDTAGGVASAGGGALFTVTETAPEVP